MKAVYKVRAYCSSANCDYIHKADILDAISYEAAVSNALMFNERGTDLACPDCEASLTYYPYTMVDQILIIH